MVNTGTRESGGTVSVDLGERQADRFMRCLLTCCGYELPGGRGYPLPPDHCDVYAMPVKTLKAGVPRRVRPMFKLTISSREGPVKVRTTHSISGPILIGLAEWLAPRLGWKLYEEAA